MNRHSASHILMASKATTVLCPILKQLRERLLHCVMIIQSSLVTRMAAVMGMLRRGGAVLQNGLACTCVLMLWGSRR
jgi:hypothetical protein